MKQDSREICMDRMDRKMFKIQAKKKELVKTREGYYSEEHRGLHRQWQALFREWLKAARSFA